MDQPFAEFWNASKSKGAAGINPGEQHIIFDVFSPKFNQLRGGPEKWVAGGGKYVALAVLTRLHKSSIAKI